MLDAAEAGLQDIAFETRQPSGVLRVTAPAMLAQSSVVDSIASFSVTYPQVQVSMDFSDARRDVIADGFDVAIRMGSMKDSTLKALGLFEMTRWVVASPDYIAGRKKPVSPEDLVDWDWLELAPVWQKRQEFRRGRKRKQIAVRNARLSVNNVQALAQMAQAGAGVAVVPAVIATPLVDSGQLVHVLPTWSLTSINAFAVWPANAPREGLIRLFLDHMRKASNP
jgi:DNA-binding transcriptional LysR family regulator